MQVLKNSAVSCSNGGIKKWMKDNLAFICGVSLTFLLWKPQWTFSTNLSIGFASLIGIFTYFCAYALYLHARIERYELENNKLLAEQTLFKLRTYKLSRYLTPTVWKAVNEGREESLKTEHKRVTVFFQTFKASAR